MIVPNAGMAFANHLSLVARKRIAKMMLNQSTIFKLGLSDTLLLLPESVDTS